MMNIEFVRSVSGPEHTPGQTLQTLWNVDGSFYVASSRVMHTDNLMSLDETMVFPADSTGKITDYGDLAVEAPAVWKVDEHKVIIEKAVNYENSRK
tara:strand:- start:1584 stop:1871 length:288 start_codon:yes stop_codon:yes gene_type:complete